MEFGLVERWEGSGQDTSIMYGVTLKGSAFSMASAARPITRIPSILGQFITRVAAVNSNAEFAYNVRWGMIFGSYLGGKERINDVDLGVELVRRHKDDLIFEACCHARIKFALRGGRRFSSVVEEVSWPRTEVLLFLRNRSKVLSLCDWESLRYMPALSYCVLIGDEKRIAEQIPTGRVIECPKDEGGARRKRRSSGAMV